MNSKLIKEHVSQIETAISDARHTMRQAEIANAAKRFPGSAQMLISPENAKEVSLVRVPILIGRDTAAHPVHTGIGTTRFTWAEAPVRQSGGREPKKQKPETITNVLNVDFRKR